MNYVICFITGFNYISIIAINIFLWFKLPADGYFDIPMYITSWWTLLGLPISSLVCLIYILIKKNNSKTKFLKKTIIVMMPLLLFFLTSITMFTKALKS